MGQIKLFKNHLYLIRLCRKQTSKQKQPNKQLHKKMLWAYSVCVIP